MESYFMSIKINNAEGDKYAKIFIPYLKENPISHIEAWTEDVNGKKIRTLTKKEITDISNIQTNNLYDEGRVKIFDLKNNAYPYIIKYKYSCKKKHFLSICDWVAFHREIPTHAAKLVIDIPSSYKVSFFENKIDAPHKDSIKDRIILTWQAKYEKPLSPEVCSPPMQELTPRVCAAPVQFNYGISGSLQDWAAFGNWDYNLNKGLDDLPPSEVQNVNELIKGISDKRLIVKRLYEYLQENTRYVSVQIGVGGFKSFPASFVAEKKYGDCKALSNYMKALLKTAGIPSYAALVFGGNEEGTYKIINDFVFPQFNHVILMVLLDKDTMWLDCTSKTNPAGYLGTFTQNRYALVVDENKSSLVKTPALVPSNCYTLCNNDIYIDTTGNALLKSSTICKGYGFDINTLYSTALNKDRQKEYLEAIIPYQDFEVKQLNIKNEGSDSTAIKLDYQIILKSNTTQSGNYLFLQLCSPRLPEFETPSKRHFPVRLAWPINYIDTTKIAIPDKYTIKKNIDEDIESPYGLVKIKYILHDNKIEVCRNIVLKSGEYTLYEYPDFYRFIAKIHETINVPICFTKYE